MAAERIGRLFGEGRGFGIRFALYRPGGVRAATCLRHRQDRGVPVISAQILCLVSVKQKDGWVSKTHGPVYPSGVRKPPLSKRTKTTTLHFGYSLTGVLGDDYERFYIMSDYATNGSLWQPSPSRDRRRTHNGRSLRSAATTRVAPIRPLP